MAGEESYLLPGGPERDRPEARNSLPERETMKRIVLPEPIVLTGTSKRGNPFTLRVKGADVSSNPERPLGEIYGEVEMCGVTSICTLGSDAIRIGSYHAGPLRKALGKTGEDTAIAIAITPEQYLPIQQSILLLAQERHNSLRSMAATASPVAFVYFRGCDYADTYRLQWSPLDDDDAREFLDRSVEEYVEASGSRLLDEAKRLFPTDVEKLPGDLSSYYGERYTGEALAWLLSTARQELETGQERERRLEAQRQLREIEIEEAAQGRQIIGVAVESRPHAEKLDGVLLNRPAPNSGAFILHARLERSVWERLKAAGASYYSQDDIDDFDMFEAEPGWRYSLAAIQELTLCGFAALIEGEVFISPDALAAYFVRPTAATGQEVG